MFSLTCRHPFGLGLILVLGMPIPGAWVSDPGAIAPTFNPHLLASQVLTPTAESPIFHVGQLDLTPEPQTFRGIVSSTEPEDIYSFSLQAASKVQLKLEGLSSRANLLLADQSGKVIAQSTNPDAQAEEIVKDLNPGSYYVLVRSVRGTNTSYNLTLGAQFIVNETVVSTVNGRLVNMPDPEFDTVGNQITWQDNRENLRVAPIDEDGNFRLEETAIIDADLAPSAPAGIGLGGTGNGPEWVYTAQNSEIVYTKLISGNFYLGRARKVNNDWTTEILPDSKFGLAPVGTLNPGDSSPLIRYFLGTPDNQRQAVAWQELNNPDVKGIVPGTQNLESPSAGRWIEGERALVYVSPDATGTRQVFRYDVDLDRVTQLTFDSNAKVNTFAWFAPEYGEILLLTVETVNTKTSSFAQVGIYRNLNGVWTRIAALRPPSGLTSVRSAEPFVYNGKSYVSFVAEDAFKQPSEIWIAGIDPDVEFYRQVSDPAIEMVRDDPEAYITASGPFIYYTRVGEGVIYKAATGL